MRENYKVTALLTGRGNNTLEDKNVRKILDHPVLYYPANAARKSAVIDKYYCSSDDPKILSAAEALGYERIMRPAELATPISQHKDCILHALDIMNSMGDMPDILIVLLANNVTIKSEWITDCVKDVYKRQQSTESVLVRLRDVDFLYSLIRSGLISMKLWWAFSRKSSRLRA